MLSHCGPSINECTKSFVVESPTSGCGILKLPLILDNDPGIITPPVVTRNLSVPELTIAITLAEAR